MHSEPQWTVTIEPHGRCGLIHYREGENSALFDWEFAAGPAVVLIWPRHTTQWDEMNPWAHGRKGEIMEKVARDVCRQKAPDCSIKIDVAESSITILESTPA